MNKFLCGPWVGELSWELFCWQAYLRRLSNRGHEISIIADSKHFYLYEDFCKEFIDYEHVGVPNKWKSSRESSEEIKRIIETFKDLGYLILEPSNLFGNEEQDFIKFGELISLCTQKILIYPLKGVRPKKAWEEIVSCFDKEKFCLVGEREKTYNIEGARDYRDMDLSLVCNEMKNAKLTIGPASGMLYLANLCECPNVVWGSSYKEAWNPFVTRVTWINSSLDIINFLSKEI